MSLVTGCPICATTFRVSPAQLSARGGRVRCGKCATIFDGVAGLLTEEAIAALPEEPSPQMGLFDPRSAARGPRESDEIAPAQPETLPATSRDPRSPAPSSDNATLTAGFAASSASTAGSMPEPDPAQPLPAFLKPARPRTSYALVWALLALLSLAALAGQAVLHYRSEFLVLLPQARPYIEAACEILDCELRLPRRADLMSIESSDLQTDTQRKGVIVLNALLRNRAPFVQEYPDLELTLTDQGDRAVVRRVLKPREYLQQKAAVAPQGIAGGAEEAVRVHLDTGSMLATGYQLFLFYPCPPMSSSPYWQLSYPSRCQDSRNK